MNAKFIDIYQATDSLGPGALEVPMYSAEIQEQARRRGVFGQRIKQVPATGHPSRFFLEGDRAEHSVPLKAIAAEINYYHYEAAGEEKKQYAYLQARDLHDTVDGVLRTHDVALWNGKDTSLDAPTSPEYFGVAAQIIAGGHLQNVQTTDGIVAGLALAAERVAKHTEDAPMAIYANPVLLDLIDREIKTEFGDLRLSTREILPGFRVKVLATMAGDLPLIPEWTLPYTGQPGSGTAILPAYIVTESLIEYHWLFDPLPRVFQRGEAGKLDQRFTVVKFGVVVVKHPGTAHCQVLVER